MTRPLVVRFGALGDMVLMTVAIRRLSVRFGSCVDVVSSGDWTEPLLKGQSGVGDIYLLRGRGRPFWAAPDQWQLVRALRRRGAGPTWLFDARTAQTRRLLTRAGWGTADLLTLDQLPDIPGEHFCDHWRRFSDLSPARVGSSVVPDQSSAAADSAFPELTLQSQLRPGLTRWLQQRGLQPRRYILLQAGNKRTMRRGSRRRASNTKYWPEQHWATLLRGLRELHPDHVLLLLGIAPESPMNEEILAMAGGFSNAINLAREMSVPRLMALSEGALGMISVDTGPAHVAAALGCPVLALFDSPDKQAMYAPRGRVVSRACVVGGTDAAPSLLGISAEAVLKAWQEMDMAPARTQLRGDVVMRMVGQSLDSQARQSQYNAEL